MGRELELNEKSGCIWYYFISSIVKLMMTLTVSPTVTSLFIFQYKAEQKFHIFCRKTVTCCRWKHSPDASCGGWRESDKSSALLKEDRLEKLEN